MGNNDATPMASPRPASNRHEITIMLRFGASRNGSKTSDMLCVDLWFIVNSDAVDQPG
jgi:hypothetical protein